MPKYNQTFFIIKHTITFISLAVMIVVVMMLIYDKILIQYQAQLTKRSGQTVKLLTVSMIGILFISVALLQNRAIALFETPPIVKCYYYDQYGHYIHGSRFTYTCPELETITKEDDVLHARFFYQYPGNVDYGVSSYNNGPLYRGYQAYALVDIVIEYNEEHFITSYTSTTSINMELKIFEEDKETYEIKQFYQGVAFSIETDFGENIITQTKKHYLKRTTENEFDALENVIHQTLTEDDEYSEQSFQLRILTKEANDKTFEIINLDDDEAIYFGEVYFLSGHQYLSLEHNPETVNLTPPIMSDTFLLKGEQTFRTNIVGQSTVGTLYESYEGYPMIRTKVVGKFPFEEVEQSNIYLRKDFLVVKEEHATYKVTRKSYGFIIQEYHNDGYIEEQPKTHDSELYVWASGSDTYVLGYLGGNLLYHSQPVFMLNPMIEYIIK